MPIKLNTDCKVLLLTFKNIQNIQPSTSKDANPVHQITYNLSFKVKLSCGPSLNRKVKPMLLHQGTKESKTLLTTDLLSRTNQLDQFNAKNE